MFTLLGFFIGISFFKGLMSGIICALIGYFVFDKNFSKKKKIEQQQNAHNVFTTDAVNNLDLMDYTFRLMGYVARGAGRVNQAHISSAETIMNVMHLPNDAKELMKKAFGIGKDPDFNPDETLAEYRRLTQDNGNLISYLLEIIIMMALSDGVLESNEHNRLHEIAAKLGVSQSYMENLINIRMTEMRFQSYFNEQKQHYYESNQSSSNQGYQRQEQYEQSQRQSYERQSSSNQGSYQGSKKSELELAYELLGVSSSSTNEEIKKAHKKLMLKYHPDRLASQGLSAEMIKLYTERAKNIQAAFNLIKSHRGF